ncbi:TetR/AcrR family transcriptional regulator [Gordonia sp. NPDC003425]
MGRTAGYDAAQLIRDARDLFWRNGFDTVSVADMEAATGVRRSSIYHAYGSMRGLFDAAVDDYLTEVVRPRLRPLTAADVTPEALVDYLAGLRDAVASMSSAGGPAGCLLLGCAATPIGTDKAVHAVIDAYRTEQSAAVRRGVAAMLPEAGPAAVDRHTTLTVAAIIAALSMARVDQSASSDILDAAADSLRAARAIGARTDETVTTSSK